MEISVNNVQPFTSNSEGEVVRPIADFSTSIWVDFFVSRSSSQTTDQASRLVSSTYELYHLTKHNFKKQNKLIEQKVEELIVEVKAMLRTNTEVERRLTLIYALKRLAICYHFEEEIGEALICIHSDDMDIDHDLRLVALRFLLLRQQGYNVPSDVFDKFKDHDGKFNQELSCEAKGLLYLYEAAFLANHEDENLHEALVFARGHLEHMAKHVDDKNSAEIRYALELPFRRRMRSLEAREYIPLYAMDEDHYPLVLKLAKLNFNLVQSLYQAEITTMSLWWKGLELADNLTFARHRVAECYLWSMGICFEPRYSQVRLLLGKLIFMMTVIDDIYDAYGTYDELELLTDVIVRWDLQDVDHLPNYMKVYMASFADFVWEIKEELARKRCPQYMHFIVILVHSFPGIVIQCACMGRLGLIKEEILVYRICTKSSS